MKLSILYGLKKKVERFPGEDPDARVIGTFKTPEAAQEYVNAGGLPPEFRYFAVAVEEGNFWVVDSVDEWSREKGHTLDSNVILAGPFDDPESAMVAQIRINRGSVQCTSTEWSSRCERKEVSPEVRPPLEWAYARLERWSAQSNVGQAEISLAETTAFSRVVREWVEAGAPGNDPEYEKQIIDFGNKLINLRSSLQEVCDAHRDRARKTKDRLLREKRYLN